MSQEPPPRTSRSLAGAASPDQDNCPTGAWRPWALLSLAFTSASGLQAIAFWAIRGDFDLAWWLPNLFLLLYPVAALPVLLRLDDERAP